MISIEKGLLPNLWRILKLGGQNCAPIIYPNILPLLNELSKLSLEKKTLFVRLFENLREGMGLKQNWSRSESTAVITTFYECFRYVILSNIQDVELCELLVKKQVITQTAPFVTFFYNYNSTHLKQFQLMSAIKLSLSESCSQPTLHYNEVVQLVRFWSKNRDCYSNLVQFFWSELKCLYDDLRDSAKSCPTQLQRLCDFLTALKKPTSFKKTARVTFSDDTATSKADSGVAVKILDVDQVLLQELDRFVISFCTCFFDQVNSCPDKNGFENILRLASNFWSREFFLALARSRGDSATLLSFYTETLEKWLVHNAQDAENVMPLAFNILEFIDDAEKTVVLDSMLKVDTFFSALFYSTFS